MKRETGPWAWDGEARQGGGMFEDPEVGEAFYWGGSVSLKSGKAVHPPPTPVAALLSASAQV